MAIVKKIKPESWKCATVFCKNKCYKKRKDGKTCGVCRVKKFRKDNPMKAAYNNLKANAKRRGKEFTLTFKQFKSFCIKTDYIKGVGRSSESYSIDRRDNNKGYTAGNIRMMTKGENSSKGVKKHLEYDWLNRTATVKTHGVKDRNEDDPF